MKFFFHRSWLDWFDGWTYCEECHRGKTKQTKHIKNHCGDRCEQQDTGKCLYCEAEVKEDRSWA